LRFADSDSSNWVAFQAPATVSSNVTWTLPAADGTANQALVTNGSGTLSWAAAGGGKVLQVVTATTSTQVTVSNQTFTDTTLTASITPANASNKILVLVTQPVGLDLFGSYSGTNFSNLALDLYRGATKIYAGGIDSSGGYTFGLGTTSTINGFGLRNIINITILDSPSTTSSTTYKTQLRNGLSGATAFTSWGSTAYPISTIILMEIGA
jgi:hypothetical protein